MYRVQMPLLNAAVLACASLLAAGCATDVTTEIDAVSETALHKKDKSDKDLEWWRAERDEKPNWSTPVLFHGERPELVTNGANLAQAYDPRTGHELWLT